MTRKQTILSRVELLDQDTLATNDATITRLVVNLQHDESITVRGSAKRHPDDRSNADIGALLSEARAYRSLAEKLQSRAEGLMKHREDVAIKRSRIRRDQASHDKRKKEWLEKRNKNNESTSNASS